PLEVIKPQVQCIVFLLRGSRESGCEITLRLGLPPQTVLDLPAQVQERQLLRRRTARSSFQRGERLCQFSLRELRQSKVVAGLEYCRMIPDTSRERQRGFGVLVVLGELAPDGHEKVGVELRALQDFSEDLSGCFVLSLRERSRESPSKQIGGFLTHPAIGLLARCGTGIRYARSGGAETNRRRSHTQKESGQTAGEASARFNADRVDSAEGARSHGKEL